MRAGGIGARRILGKLRNGTVMTELDCCKDIERSIGQIVQGTMKARRVRRCAACRNAAYFACD
jgi:hypothetical protein